MMEAAKFGFVFALKLPFIHRLPWKLIHLVCIFCLNATKCLPTALQVIMGLSIRTISRWIFWLRHSAVIRYEWNIAKKKMFGVHMAIDFVDFGFLRILAKISRQKCPSLNMFYAKHRLKVDGQKAFRLTARNARNIAITFSKEATANETLSQSIIAFCA